MKELFTLGELHISDFIPQDQQPTKNKGELKMLFNENTAEVRLDKPVDPNQMYGKYWYRSGINHTMRNELKAIVENIQSVYKLKKGDLWLDIACNDGTLLSYVPNDLIKVGIDPVEDSFKNEAERYADLIIQDYFSLDAIKKTRFKYEQADVITCIAMFYDLEDPSKFLKDVYDFLKNDGLFVLQLSYTPLMIDQLAFDNICHEHIYYYSLYTLKNLLNRNGFKVVDCSLNDVNGGSFRVFAMKDVGNIKKFSTQPNRDVCNFRIKSLLQYEYSQRYNTVDVWEKFYERLLQLKEQTYNFILDEKAKGKRVWGYGASTKGNTLLQFFGLDDTMIDGIAERSSYKFGLKTAGSNIPIYSEEEMRQQNPDYLLILPWHFIDEFKQREKEFLNRGGKFIVPCPKFEIIG